MKVELENLSPVKKTVSIEVPVDEVGREIDQVLALYRRRVRLPGFRAGKVPLDLVRRRFGSDVHEEVRDRLLARSFHRAAEENGLRPIGEPTVDGLTFDDGGPLSYKATFEVLPKIELRGYKSVELRRTKPRLEEAEIDRALEELRQSRVRLVTEEGRAASIGDVVVADFAGTPAGEGKPFRRERMPIEVGGEGNLPEFNEHLMGARAGAKLDFQVVYPPEYGSKELAGKTVAFELVVHEVKRRDLPALDDEFARDLGEFGDLGALRERVRGDLELRKEEEERRDSRQAVLDKVLVENPIVLPDVLVEREIRHRLEDIVRGMILRGIDPEKTEVDWQGLRKRQEEPARKIVHAGLILDAVVAAEKLENERAAIDERIRQDARRLGEAPEKLRERLKKQGGMEALRTQMCREKALDYLTSVANIQYSE